MWGSINSIFHVIENNYLLFQQPVLSQSQLGDSDNPYDATKTGPLCAQGTTDSDALDELLNKEVTEIISDLLSSLDIGLPLPEELFIGIIENILKVNLTDKSGYDLLDELIDVQSVEFAEDCLHLAVSTPQKPQVVFFLNCKKKLEINLCKNCLRRLLHILKSEIVTRKCRKSTFFVKITYDIYLGLL